MATSKRYTCLLICQLLALSAAASPVTFFFTGQINSEAINGCGVLVPCGVVFGSYTFDSASPDQNADPATGLYAATNITFSIDGVSFFASPSAVINVANFSPPDQYGVLATGIASNSSTATLSILLADATGAAFSSDALPQNPAALTSLFPGTFQLNAADDTFQLLGSIDFATTLPAGSGLVRVCKIGSAGIAPGTNFSFNVSGSPLVVRAGACSQPFQEPAGPIAITETLPPGVVLTAIATSPDAALVSSDLTAGASVVNVDAAMLTTVTFNDALLANTGLVQVCKSAGSGVPLGTTFAFNVAGTHVPVAAGSCAAPLREPTGPTAIIETLTSGITLTNVSVSPSAALVASNLAAGTATVAVTAGFQTTATFTNTLAEGVAIASGAFQVRYASHLDVGDSYINLTNSGNVAGATLNGADPSGNICVNAYTFDPAEELISCCACLVTPNALTSLSVRNDLLSNTLTPAKPTAVVIDLVASTPILGVCNPGTPSATNLVLGVRAWGTSLHALPGPSTVYGSTETFFSPSPFSQPQLQHLTSVCQFIQSNGSGFGACKTCQSGGR